MRNEQSGVPVKIAKVFKDSVIPKYETNGAAGFDIAAYLPYTKEERRVNDAHWDVVYDHHPVTIAPGERKLIGTGLRFQVPQGYELQLRPRSGLALKKGISLTNSPATIDSDFTGEVGVILENRGEEPFVVSQGDRICQGVVKEAPQAAFELVDDLDETDRGQGGFGSTGVSA